MLFFSLSISTLELDYTLPKEKEKNGIAANADPPRRSKKARTQPKSELSALLPPQCCPRRCLAYCDCVAIVPACSGLDSASGHGRKASSAQSQLRLLAIRTRVSSSEGLCAFCANGFF